MNSKLRKICHKKAMLSNRYYKNGRQKHDWEEFRKIRNLAMKLPAKSMNAYFNKNCNKIHKEDPKKFWNTMKPFVNDKSKGNDECQMLNINGTVCNDLDIIAEEFNSYFSNVFKNICKEKPLEYDDCLEDIFSQHEGHESVSRIRWKIFPKTSLILMK